MTKISVLQLYLHSSTIHMTE